MRHVPVVLTERNTERFPPCKAGILQWETAPHANRQLCPNARLLTAAPGGGAPLARDNRRNARATPARGRRKHCTAPRNASLHRASRFRKGYPAPPRSDAGGSHAPPCSCGLHALPCCFSPILTTHPTCTAAKADATHFDSHPA